MTGISDLGGPHMVELHPVFANVKSFGGKALILTKGNIKVLRSYSTNVAEFNTKTKKLKIDKRYTTATTNRHVAEFMKQMGFDVKDKAKYLI